MKTNIRSAIQRYLERCAPDLEFPLGKPVPLPTDDELLFLNEIQNASDLSANQLEIFRDSLSIRQCYDLVIFAVRMAVLAVRINCPNYLTAAFLGLVVDDNTADFRDILSAIAIIENCAMRLNMDFVDVVDNAFRLATPERRDLIKNGYLSRPPNMKGIAVMGFKASGDASILDFDKSF